jgi:hypothetical protein
VPGVLHGDFLITHLCDEIFVRLQSVVVWVFALPFESACILLCFHCDSRFFNSFRGLIAFSIAMWSRSC